MKELIYNDLYVEFSKIFDMKDLSTFELLFSEGKYSREMTIKVIPDDEIETSDRWLRNKLELASQALSYGYSPITRIVIPLGKVVISKLASPDISNEIIISGVVSTPDNNYLSVSFSASTEIADDDIVELLRLFHPIISNSEKKRQNEIMTPYFRLTLHPGMSWLPSYNFQLDTKDVIFDFKLWYESILENPTEYGSYFSSVMDEPVEVITYPMTLYAQKIKTQIAMEKNQFGKSMTYAFFSQKIKDERMLIGASKFVSESIGKELWRHILSQIKIL